MNPIDRNKIAVPARPLHMFFPYNAWGNVLNLLLGWALFLAWFYSILISVLMLIVFVANDRSACPSDGCFTGNNRRDLLIYNCIYGALGWYVLLVFLINKRRLQRIPGINVLNMHWPTSFNIVPGLMNQFFAVRVTDRLECAFAAVQHNRALLSYFQSHRMNEGHFHLFNSPWKRRNYDLAMGLGVYYWIMAIVGSLNLILTGLFWHRLASPGNV
jgi:hypothetical protein